MADKHIKRCPTPLIIKEVQIKTKGRYCYINIKITEKTAATNAISSSDNDVKRSGLTCIVGRNVK